MMRGSNSRRRFVSPRHNGLGVRLTLLVLPSILLLLYPVYPARAAEPAPAKTIELAAPKVDRSDAAEIHRRVRQWVAAGSVADPGKPLKVSGLTGVKVSLRWSGKLVGDGEYLVPNPEAAQFTGEAIDLNAAARAATERALKEAEEMLQDSRRKVESDPEMQKLAKTRPATSQPSTLSAAAKWLTTDVQIALRLEPIRLGADAPPDAVYRQFAAGFHGLRMSQPAGKGKADEAWKWPASAIASNISPPSQIIQLLAALGLSDETAKKVARPGGPTLQRFEVLHVTQNAPREPAMQLVRGNLVLPESPLSGRTLESIISRLGEHLLNRVRADGEMVGTYLPSEDRFKPANATDEELAITAYALTRWVARSEADSSMRAKNTEIETSVRKMVDLLVIRLQDQAEPLDPASTALLLATLIESPRLREMKDARDAAGKRLLALRRSDGSFYASTAGDAPELNATNRALITAALARLYERTRAAELGRAVRQSRDLMWSKMSPTNMVGALPWLMIVETDRGILEEPIGEKPAAPSNANAALKTATRDDRTRRIRVMMQLLRETQVTHAPSVGPADVVGGFDFSPASAAPVFATSAAPGAPAAGLADSGPPNPDWRSAYAVWFIAAAMREPGVIKDADQIDWLLSGGLGARFLAQLMFDEPSCYYVCSQADALGGIRLALWDNRVEIPPTAITLIAAMELERAASELATKGLLNGKP